MSKLEGNGASRFIQLIRQHGYNTDTDVMIGTVKAAPPSIKIRLDGDNFDLDADDLVVGGKVAEDLTAGDRVIVLVANKGQQYYVIDKAVTY